MVKHQAKAPRKTAKRGPKEDRLVITDPQAALDKLLRKPAKPTK